MNYFYYRNILYQKKIYKIRFNLGFSDRVNKMLLTIFINFTVSWFVFREQRNKNINKLKMNNKNSQYNKKLIFG